MADTKIHAGVRFNDPVAKYMRFDIDKLAMKLDVYLTIVLDGREITVRGVIPQEGWFPVEED